MSADIWSKINETITTQRPDLANEFKTCRNRETIVAFLNKHFPLQGIVTNPDWDAHLLIRIPEMMQEHGSREEWKRVEAK